MTDTLLLLALLLTGIFGYWVMDRIDRFLEAHVKGEWEEDESEHADSA